MKKTFFALNKVQDAAKRAAMKAFKGGDKALIRMTTGTGKTETAIKTFLAMDTKNDKRLLWLTHTNELIGQTAERFVKLSHNKGNEDLSDVGIFAGRQKDLDNKIIVASISSLARQKNLEMFDPNDFDCVVVDEAHHSPSPSWSKVISYFDAKILGLTATPYRPDGLDVEEQCGKIIYDLDFGAAQEKGIVAKEDGRIVLTESVINGFVSSNGEYSPKQLEKLYSSQQRNNIIVSSYRKYARGAIISDGLTPKTFCFCINIQHAIRMSEMFKSAGFKAAFICGNHKYQSKEEREEVWGKFQDTHDIEILCAVKVGTEGADVADANIVLLCRPTQSGIVYHQQLGRASRIDGGRKRRFYVMDYLDLTNNKFQSYTMGNLLGAGHSRTRIITEYLEHKDEVVTDRRIKDIMRNFRDFEVNMRSYIDASKVNEENLKHFLKTGEERWLVTRR